MVQKKHEFLTTSVLIILVVGVILSYVGNTMVRGAYNPMSKRKDKKILTCNPDILKNINTNQDNANSGYIVAFTGNIITCVGIVFLILLSSLFATNYNSQNESIFTVFKKILMNIFPCVLTLGVIIYLIVLESIYTGRIKAGEVAEEYFSYSSISSLLILLQVGLLVKYILDMANGDNDYKTYGYIIYLFGLVNLIIIGVMQVILQFFSTDG